MWNNNIKLISIVAAYTIDHNIFQVDATLHTMTPYFKV